MVKKGYKRVTKTTGRVRKIGVRNTTDRGASKANRKRRRKCVVSSTDKGPKRHRRRNCGTMWD